MESFTIYPKNEKQKSLLKSLLEEMKIRFVLESDDEDTKYSADHYFSKIDKSIEQASQGKRKKISIEEQKNLLGL
jgi:hypothetical protein